MKVFLVQHAYERDGADEIKLIGIYGSLEQAEAAQARAACLPGFKDHPDGFSVDGLEVGQDCWTSGFATVRWREEDVDAEEAA